VAVFFAEVAHCLGNPAAAALAFAFLAEDYFSLVGCWSGEELLEILSAG